MAVYGKQVLDLTLPAAADYTGSQYYLAEIDTNGRASVCNATTDKPIGILQNKPAAVDRPAHIRAIGHSKLVAGAAIARDVDISTTSAGKGTTSQTNGYVAARALSAASAAAETIEVFVQCVNMPIKT